MSAADTNEFCARVEALEDRVAFLEMRAGVKRSPAASAVAPPDLQKQLQIVTGQRDLLLARLSEYLYWDGITNTVELTGPQALHAASERTEQLERLPRDPLDRAVAALKLVLPIHITLDATIGGSIRLYCEHCLAHKAIPTERSFHAAIDEAAAYAKEHKEHT